MREECRRGHGAARGVQDELAGRACNVLWRPRLEILQLPEINSLPAPQNTLKFIRSTLIVTMMEPEDDGGPGTSIGRSALEVLAGGRRGRRDGGEEEET